MVGLPRSIIKKYGVSKQAWKVFRGMKRGNTTTQKTSVSRPVTQTQTQVTTMNRRYFGKKRSRSSSSSGGISLKSMVIPALAYGAVRQKISTMLDPITSKIPLGSIADEAVLAGAAYLIDKKVKNKTIKSFARAAFYVEMARIGEAAIDGSLLGNKNASNASGASGKVI